MVYGEKIEHKIYEFFRANSNCGFKNFSLKQNGDVQVELGKLNAATSASTILTVPPFSVKVHPDYNSSTYENDIALIKLPSTFNLTGFI
jgi:hypothetical protein